MLLNTKKLSNGINLNFLQSNKFKTGILVINLGLPLTFEGAAHSLLLSSLMSRGTKKYPSIALINKSLDELYGSYVEIRSSHVCNESILTISSEILDSRFIPDDTDVLSGVLEILSELLLFPKFMEEDFDVSIFEHEKKTVLDNLKSEKNNTRTYALKRCTEILREEVSSFPTHERLMDLVANTSLDKIRSYYKELLSTASPNVFYIGGTALSEISKKLVDIFPDQWKDIARTKTSPLLYERSSFASVKESMPVSQGKLALGFSTGACISHDDDEYYTALMLNEIFGGSPASKLFLNVREKMGLCYYCSSSYSIYTGAMMVSSGIEVSKLDIVRKAILSQLDEIKKGNISEYELKAAQSSISNSYRQLYDNPLDMQSFYSGRALFGVKDSIEDCIKKLMKVRAEDISKLAKTISLDAEFFVEGTLCGNECQEDADDE